MPLLSYLFDLFEMQADCSIYSNTCSINSMLIVDPITTIIFFV
jgi:hypothetical protein